MLPGWMKAWASFQPLGSATDGSPKSIWMVFAVSADSGDLLRRVLIAFGVRVGTTRE
jgi:hypothetical protein